MLTKTVRRGAFLVVLGVLAIACKGGGPDESCVYAEPVAKAGPDQSGTVGDTVSLTGEASTVSCEGELSYSWSFTQVPLDSALDDTIFDPGNGSSTAKVVNFEPDAIGTYVVSLIVNDSTSTSREDIVVVDIYADNLPPVANAGADTTGEIGQQSKLDGSLSSDDQGADLEYLWTLVSQPEESGLTSADVFEADTAFPGIVPDVSGTYVLALVVSDGQLWSDPDYASVMVASENTPPVADAGPSTTLYPCTDPEFVDLNGRGSFDAEGAALTYTWTVYSVPGGSSATDANFDDVNAAAPTFNYDVIGTYVFHLQVNDGLLDSAFDEVSITIVDPSDNDAPIANAGADQTLEASADCSSHSYVVDCEPCSPVAFDLDGGNSSDPNGDPLDFEWTETSGDITLTTPTLGFTQAWSPPLPADTTAASTSWDVSLKVSDCAYSATDTVKITVTCQGEL